MAKTSCPQSQKPVVEASPPLATPVSAPRGRSTWAGLLQFSLVTVPVKAYPAADSSADVHFNQLHADCGQRIRYEKHCPAHGKVDAAAIVRGYQYAPDQYVVVDVAELEALRPAKDKALMLERFLEAGDIDPIYFSGRTLYLLPDGLGARRPYAVLLQAMQQRRKWALGRVVLSGHRHLVLVRPRAPVLAMDVLLGCAKPRHLAVSWGSQDGGFLFHCPEFFALGGKPSCSWRTQVWTPRRLRRRCGS